MKSESEKDMHVFQRRLARKLDEERVPLDNSFGFLNESMQQVSGATCDASLDSSSSTGNDTVIQENRASCSETDTGDTKENATINLVLCEMKKISSILRKDQHSLEKLVKEVKSVKKVLPKNPATTPLTDCEISPVYFNNADLTRLGHNNMDPSQFAICLARHLFSDEEIERNMLFPKRSSSRPSLSPNRSNIFKNAVLSRFRENSMEEACRAVNCLGTD
ncbi:MAG: hypothetical protein AAGK05_11630 [Pseudomonadota bacterium]